MKTIFLLSSLFAGALILFSACGPKYPELDSVIAEKLQPSGIPGVWVAFDPGVSNKDIPGSIKMCKKDCVLEYTYIGQLPYNITICKKPDFMINPEVTAMARKVNQDSLLPLLNDKASPTHVLHNQQLTGYNIVFCHTTAGPWGAELKELELCTVCEDVHRYTLAFKSLPVNIQWSWYGTKGDAPPGTPGFNQFIVKLPPGYQDCNATDPIKCDGNDNPDPEPDPGDPNVITHEVKEKK